MYLLSPDLPSKSNVFFHSQCPGGPLGRRLRRGSARSLVTPIKTAIGNASVIIVLTIHDWEKLVKSTMKSMHVGISILRYL